MLKQSYNFTIDNSSNCYDVDVTLVDADFNNSITRVLTDLLKQEDIYHSYLIDVENTPRDTYNNCSDEYGD